MAERIEILEHHLPVVAIVGRPNVGKSALFNRIVGRRKAVVLEVPGLTRDRNFERADWGGREFLVCDTGGYEVAGVETGAGPLKDEMREQALLAMEEAAVVVLLVDARDGLTPLDHEVMEILRRAGKPMLVAANKCDNPQQETMASEFYQLGVERVFPISAMHGLGVGDLLDAIVESLPEAPEAIEEEIDSLRIAVVGRQNVGKSSLVNAMLGEERVIVADLPGTTRDAIDTRFRRGDRVFTLIDTAGLRRRGKIQRGIEGLSAISAKASLARCDVALVVIDAEAGITAQDAHIAGAAAEAGRGVAIIVNKWDAVEKDTGTTGQWVKRLRDEWGFLSWAPIQFVSALTGQRVVKLFDLVTKIHTSFTRRIPTHDLNRALAEMLA
ncbi:ribosome biogenesis GTPase Der, partial [Candidatus Sumerlaeota bacterium]|nr:ribosome biogenesis GTPase Der [Candidatus Sumerlaeota bacterium]